MKVEIGVGLYDIRIMLLVSLEKFMFTITTVSRRLLCVTKGKIKSCGFGILYRYPGTHSKRNWSGETKYQIIRGMTSDWRSV